MNARDFGVLVLFELWRDALAEVSNNLVDAPMDADENKRNLFRLVHRWKHHHKHDHLLFKVSYLTDFRFFIMGLNKKPG